MEFTFRTIWLAECEAAWSPIWARATARGVSRMPSIHDEEIDSDRIIVEYEIGSGLARNRSPSRASAVDTSAAYSATAGSIAFDVPTRRSG